MIRLKQLLFEATTKVKGVPASKWQKLYHGTAYGNEIRQQGFKVSTSGFGQRGLVGVALSPDDKLALKYAESHARYSGGAGKPEVLVIKTSAANLADLRGADSQYDIWVKMGIDPLKDEMDRKQVQSLNSQHNGSGVTYMLKKLGFDGAVVDNTLHGETSEEICIFDPSKVQVVARKLSGEDFVFKTILPRGPSAPPKQTGQATGPYDSRIAG